MSRRSGAVIAAVVATYMIASLTYANVWIWLMVGKATSHVRYDLYYLVYTAGLVTAILLIGNRVTTLSSLRCLALGAVAGLLVSAMSLEIVSMSATTWPRCVAEWRAGPASLLMRDFGLALMLQGWSFGAMTSWLTRLFINKDWPRVGHVAVVVAVVQVLLIALNRGLQHIHFY